MELDPRSRHIEVQAASSNPAPTTLRRGSDSGTSASPSSQAASTPQQRPQQQTTSGASQVADAPQEEGDDHDGGAESKKPRACEACRGLKVRCEPDPNDGPCRRCKKAGRSCVITAPTRKRQKKTDTRVSELEKKIDALTASLQARISPHIAKEPGPSVPQSPVAEKTYPVDTTRRSSDWRQDSIRDGRGSDTPAWNQGRHQHQHQQDQMPRHQQPAPLAGQKRNYDADSRNDYLENTESSQAGLIQEWSPLGPGVRPGEGGDVIDRGLVTMEMAVELFSRYKTQLVHHLPAVVFTPATTTRELRKSKPTLFLAVMAASSGENPALQHVLQKELMHIFANKVIVMGEKSLELVQAINIAVIWYWPPESFEELKFYQLIHIAAVMGIDIGLGSKTQPRRGPVSLGWRENPTRRLQLPDPTTLESRRTWLTCYYLASNTSMSLHRPNLIRWTTFMAESMEILRTSPEAAPTDPYLCHLVWSHHLGEEIGVQLSMEDHLDSVNLTNARTQYSLKVLERDLQKHVTSVPKELMRSTLRIGFHTVSLYMHELALHVDASNLEPIRATFNTEMLRDGIVNSETISAAHINAICECLTAIDGVIETFLGMEVSSIRCLPIFNFVRVTYSVVVLMKMYFSASMAGSELGKVINRDNMRVQQNLDTLLEKFRASAEDNKCRPASKFLVVLAMLRSWFMKQSLVESANAQNSADASTSDSDKQQQQQNYGSHASSTANTPLELLSEVAAGHTGPELRSNTQHNYFNSRPTSQPLLPDNNDRKAVGPTQSSSAAPDRSTLAASGASSSTPDLTNFSVVADSGALGILPSTSAQSPSAQASAAFPNWLTQSMLADMDFESMSAVGINLPPLDGHGLSSITMNEPWFSDMLGVFPDPNLFPF